MKPFPPLHRFLVIFALVLTGCVGPHGLYDIPTPVPTIDISTPPPTNTPVPEVTSEPEPTGTSLPLVKPPVITKENASELAVVSHYDDEVLSWIHQVVWSPDGRQLLLTGLDGIRMVDTQSFETYFSILPENLPELQTLDMVMGMEVQVAAFRPDGRHFATDISSNRNNVVLWDAQTGQFLRLYAGLDQLVGGLAFSPDGSRLAGADQGSSIIVWDVDTGEALVSLSCGYQQGTKSLAFSPNGTLLMAAFFDGDVCLWNAQTGEEAARWTLPAPVTSAIFTKDGQSLWLGDQEGSLHHLALSDQEPETTHLFTMPLVSLSLHPSGDLLAGLAGDNAVQVWDAVSGEAVFNSPGTAGAMYMLDFESQIAFSPDGTMLSAGGFSDGVRFLGLGEGMVLQPTPFSRPLSGYASLPAGMYLTYIGDILENVKVVSIDKSINEVFIDNFGAKVLSPDGSIVQVGDINGMQFWDLNTNQVQDVPAVGITSPDLQWVAVTCGEKDLSGNPTGFGVYSIEQETSACLLKGTLSEEDVSIVGFSPDSRWLAYIRYTNNWFDTDLFAAATPTPPPPPATDGLYLIDTVCLSQPDTCLPGQLGPFHKVGVRFDTGAAWFPDSQRIAFFGDPVENPFYIFDMGTEVFSPIPTSGEYREFGWLGMSVTPDGKWIAFTQSSDPFASTGTYGNDLYLQPVEGGPAKLFLHHDKENCGDFFLGSWFVKP